MQHPNPSDHARHDATLIAGHAAGDLSDAERARAESLLAECEACVDLRRDLVAIAAATRSVPAPATLARDLRLAPEQAARLRRGSWVRRLLRPFGAPGSPLRPMATAFTSLGLVGLVVGITLSGGVGLAGGAASGALERDTVPAPAATSAAAVEGYGAHAESGGPIVPLDRESDGMFYPVTQSSGSGFHLATPPIERTAVDAARTGAPKTEKPVPTQVALGAVDAASHGESGDDGAMARFTTPPNPLIPGSLALLGIGLLLFGLRIASRRVR